MTNKERIAKLRAALQYEIKVNNVNVSWSNVVRMQKALDEDMKAELEQLRKGKKWLT